MRGGFPPPCRIFFPYQKSKQSSGVIARVTALLLAIATVFLSLSLVFIMSGTPEACAADGDEDSSLAKGQEKWNKEMPMSKAHDGQPRPQDVNEGLQVIHKSQPAPDRTMQRFYMLMIPLQKQGKQNQDGQEAGNKGNQNNYNPKKPQHPPVPVRNSDYGKISKLATDLVEQVGGAPQQKIAAAVANMQGQQQGAGDASQRGAINALQEYFPIIITGNPNVANEGAGGGIGHSAQPFRPLSQAIGMVQHVPPLLPANGALAAIAGRSALAHEKHVFPIHQS